MHRWAHSSGRISINYCIAIMNYIAILSVTARNNSAEL